MEASVTTADIETLGLDTDKDRTPEEIRAQILKVHNFVLQGKITTAVATQAIKALELYAKVSGMMVVEQAAEKKTAAEGFGPG